MAISKTMLVLSIFPGIDLLGMAFEQRGFCVVRGPDPLWGGDIRTFHPPAGRFDGVIGGPPCQSHSAALHPGDTPTYPDMTPEYERAVAEAQPAWWLYENVPKAPIPYVQGYKIYDCLLNAAWFSSPQLRERRFVFGTPKGLTLPIDIPLLSLSPSLPTVMATEYTGHKSRNAGRKLGRRMKFREVTWAFGLPESFKLPHLKWEEQYRAVGNGVPLPLGLALADAIARLFHNRSEPAGEPIGNARLVGWM
jgi:DNA (cytosine-5)-methyltransferase 1